MLQQARKNIVNQLWQNYCQSLPQCQRIVAALQARGITTFPLDHFAVVDLPGQHTGIAQLSQFFSMLGFVERGRGYLPNKQNDFLWMAESDYDNKFANTVLPQVVVADFRLDAMPLEIKKIIEKYAALASPLPFAEIQSQIDRQAIQPLCELVVNYFSGRDWPLPTVAEFKAVQAFNELLAWVLVFGRQPNHFTIPVHLLTGFKSLDTFNRFVVDDLQFVLNKQGGAVIKGSEEMGIMQASTEGELVAVKLADGIVAIPDRFIEFVWRYPKTDTAKKTLLWNEYFTGFYPENADNLVESLCLEDKVNN